MIKNEKCNSMTIARKYLDSLVIEGRILGSVHPDARVKILGCEFETPVMGAALSHLKSGMAAYAQGLAMAGAFCSVGMGDNEDLGKVLATGAKVMKVIKPYADREEIFSRIRFAQENGAVAVGMDVEHATNSEDDGDSLVAGFQMKQPTLEELREYVESTTLPFFFKGVMSAKDALRAKELGAAGVILGHHNNIFRCAAPHVWLLPEIRKAVGPDFILIVDGGIEDGYDAFKALARGADLVSVGRPFIPALEKDGPQGVADVAAEYTGQLKAMMLRTGAKDVKSIDPASVREAYWLS